jgi:hypothetical protein
MPNPKFSVCQTCHGQGTAPSHRWLLQPRNSLTYISPKRTDSWCENRMAKKKKDSFTRAGPIYSVWCGNQNPEFWFEDCVAGLLSCTWSRDSGRVLGRASAGSTVISCHEWASWLQTNAIRSFTNLRLLLAAKIDVFWEILFRLAISNHHAIALARKNENTISPSRAVGKKCTKSFQRYIMRKLQTKYVPSRDFEPHLHSPTQSGTQTPLHSRALCSRTSRAAPRESKSRKKSHFSDLTDQNTRVCRGMN